jgi:hypothetical protein
LSYSLLRFILSFVSYLFYLLVIEDSIKVVKLLLNIVGVSLDTFGCSRIRVLGISIDSVSQVPVN